MSKVNFIYLFDTLVPEVILDFSPREKAAREPQSDSPLRKKKKNQEKPLGAGQLLPSEQRSLRSS